MPKWPIDAKLWRDIRHEPSLLFKLVCLRYYKLTRQAIATKKVRGKVNFKFDFSLDRAVEVMYVDRYELEMLRLLRRLLKPGDTFIDAGANIGYITAYAASLVGPKGQVHSFEPVLAYYDRLADVARLNPDYGIYVNNCALGDCEGAAPIAVTLLPNIGWNTMVDGLMAKETIRDTMMVRVRRLDDYLAERDVSRVSCVKIDTEGFELPILRGFTHFLDRFACHSYPVLLMEIAPGAYPLLGANLDELAAWLRYYSYSVCAVCEPRHTVAVSELTRTSNVVCIPAGLSLDRF
ncbi:MAG: FkbM family methyltransferase [Thermoflexales bacterium]|nr:FkbM family methyltransferase [Thermoflexales bacterium]